MKKEDELILRVFALIAQSHFRDHKMSPYYADHVRFKRSLGDGIANYVKANFPENYREEEKRQKRK